MKEKDYSSRITEEWLVDDVLQRYPSTSSSFFSMIRRAGCSPAGLFPIIPG
jgi:hypothetical protein